MRRPGCARMLQSGWNSILRQLVAALSHDLDLSTDGRSKATLRLFFNRHGLHQAQHLDGLHIAVGEHCHAELAVLLPSRDGLGHEQVEQVKAVADTVVGGCGLDPVHAAHPAAREHCSVGAYTLRVVAKSLASIPVWQEVQPVRWSDAWE